jgi:hypothetical protein
MHEDDKEYDNENNEFGRKQYYLSEESSWHLPGITRGKPCETSFTTVSASAWI